MFIELGLIGSRRRHRCFRKDRLGRLLAWAELKAEAVQVLMRKDPMRRWRVVREVPGPAELVAEELIDPCLDWQTYCCSAMVIAVKGAAAVEAVT